MHGSEPGIARLAREHDGLATGSQLLAAGLGRSAVAGRVGAGLFQRMYPDVFLLSPSAPTRRQQIRAAAIYGGDGAFISHASSSELRLWIPERTG